MKTILAALILATAVLVPGERAAATSCATTALPAGSTYFGAATDFAAIGFRYPDGSVHFFQLGSELH